MDSCQSRLSSFQTAQLKGPSFKMKHSQMFDTSLPVSPLIPLDALPDPHNVSLWCKVTEWNWEVWNWLIIAGKWGAQTRGQYQGHDLHFTQTYLLHIYILYPEYVWNLSNLALQDELSSDEGDLILTGTPSGVGPVLEGDVITGGIPGVMEIKFHVAREC